MMETDIKMELQEQGVVEVHRVTVMRDTVKICTTTLFLTFSTPDLLEKTMAAFFLPNLMRCFKFGHTSQHCKVPAKRPGCEKGKHEGQCKGRKLCSNCNGPHIS